VILDITSKMIFRKEIDNSKYFIAIYDLKSTQDLKSAAWELAVGQSVGNPHVRNRWETDDLFENHSCKILEDPEELEKKTEGIVRIAFPILNTDWEGDGVSHLLCQVMGGQVDIKDIIYCRLIDLFLPNNVLDVLRIAPKYGISGMREFTGVHNKTLLGGIVKPKTGITPEVLLEMVKEMVDGGINFIKEDEIMSNFPLCPIEKRVPLIMDYINSSGKKVVYAVCINGDPAHILKRAQRVHELGANAIHVNFWCGLGVYRSLRALDLPLFIHFQQSGSKILTEKSHRYSIDFNVLCMLAAISGVDTMHIGNLFGYSSETESEIMNYVDTLHKYNVVPTLSCGMHPGIVNAVTAKIGNQYLANVGGALHGHPQGTNAGVKAMRQAIDGDFEAPEYKLAIKQWGEVRL
jgi:ribulose-bisphosphate carboxylase large chain